MPSIPGLSQSFLDIARSALLELRVLDPGVPPTAAEANDCLVIANQMLDSLQLDALMVYTNNILDFPFVGGKQAYTMGKGGDFDTPRPSRIEETSVVLSGSEIELTIRYTTDEAEWQSVLLKTVQTTYPWIVYDSGDFPLRTLRFWPIPSGHTFRCYPWAPLTQFADLSTVYSFPPGYAEAIRLNLALRLAAPFSAQAQATTIAFAASALERIRTMNLDVPKLKCDDHISYSTNTGYVGSDIPPVY